MNKTPDQNKEVIMEMLLSGLIELKNQHLQQCAEDLTFCLNFSQAPFTQKLLAQHILGLMYFSAGQISLGKKTLFQAVGLEKKNGFQQVSIHTSHLAALLEHVQGNIHTAHEYYYTTLLRLKKNHDFEPLIHCLRMLGEFALLSGDIIKTKELWQKSIMISRKGKLTPDKVTPEWLKLMQNAFPEMKITPGIPSANKHNFHK